MVRTLLGLIMPLTVARNNVFNGVWYEDKFFPFAQQHDAEVTSREHARTINIFVHGTRIFPKFYLQELFYSPPGMIRIAELEKRSHMHSIARTLECADSTRFSYESFYAFGWDGKLSFKGRKKAAHNLYGAIQQLMEEYEQKDKARPKIRLIAHSHGGNVVLNLAKVKEPTDSLFYIDEVVLLACPVQRKTEKLVADHIFKKIYAFSSIFDVLQLADPQGLYLYQTRASEFFSNRDFPASPNLLQARVQLYGRPPLHIEFFLSKFLAAMPGLMNSLDLLAEHETNAWQTVPVIKVKKNNNFYISK